MAFRTFAEQYETYFARPGGTSVRGAIGGAAAWTADDLWSRSGWRFNVDPADLGRFEAELGRLAAEGADPRALTREQVDIGPLAERVMEWRTELQSGSGIVLVRGWPVTEWGLARTELATWCLGLHLGDPGAQNPRGELLGHVRDAAPGASSNARLYQTNADIGFHCDYADAVGLMCVRQAPIGGESRVASSTAIHDEMVRIAPDLAARLYQPVWLDTRDESAAPGIAVTPFAFDGTLLRTFYHSDYFRSVARHGGIYVPDRPLIDALDLFDELAATERFCVRMRLEAGDLQLVSNHGVVHARTTFVDDPAAPRHLLRLWLSFDATGRGS